MRELKRALIRYTAARKTHTWFPHMLTAYQRATNRRIHSGHRLRPVDVGSHNAHVAFDRLWPNYWTDASWSHTGEPKFPVGTRVRLKVVKDRLRHTFYKTFGSQTFIITQIANRHGVHLYELSAQDGSPIFGKYYAQDLAEILENAVG